MSNNFIANANFRAGYSVAKGINNNKEYAKNFALTPANQATIIPPAPIKIEVPRSGCVATKIIGATRTVIGKIKCLKLFILSIEIR